MQVEEVKLRAATNWEIAGHVLWKVATLPYTLLNKVQGTWTLYQNRANALHWTPPVTWNWTRNVTNYFGWFPELNFLKPIPTFFGTWTLFPKEPAILEELFKQKRNGGILGHGRSYAGMLEVLQKLFPDDKFDTSDLMFTCLPEMNKKYRAVILQALRGDQKDHLIQTAVQESLRSWADEDKINITEEAPRLASRIITKLLLGEDVASDSLSQSVNFMNKYQVMKVSGKLTKTDEEEYKKTLNTFKEKIEEVLSSGRPIPLFQGQDLTDQQKKALIFVIFFAGQETVGSLINYIVWKLAEEKSNTPHKVEECFTHFIHKFTPAYMVARQLTGYACLEYRLKGERKVRRMVFSSGEYLVPDILETARMRPLDPGQTSYEAWKPFGDGPHRCPGEALAKKEVYAVINGLKSNYDLELLTNETPSFVGQVTLKLSHDIWVRINKRKSD